MNPRSKLSSFALVLAVLALSACGGTTSSPAPESPSPAPSPTAAATFPVTVQAANGEVTIPARPERIVSLSPTSTEVLFAIGAGPQVVAVDDNSNYPPEAPTTDLSGYQPNIEAIASYEPDLVVASFDPGDLVSGLEALGIPVILHPAAVTLDDVYTQIEQLGVATGHVAEAAELVARMQADIDAIIASVPPRDEPLTYYHELDTTYFSVTSDTFIGRIYGLLGLQSIADAAEDAAASGGYPQLSAEFILAADPDFIFLADTKCCGVTAETVAQRPGWDTLTAVQRGAVVELDDDIASRWGPRIVDLLRTVADAVTRLAPVG